MTWLLFFLAAAPFAAKGVSLVWLANNYLAQSAYKVLQLAAPVGWRRFVERRRGLEQFWPVDQPWPRPATWAWGVAIAAVGIGLAIVCLPVLAGLFGVDAQTLRDDLDARFDMTPWRALLVVLFLTTLNSGLEELHFRVWLDRELSRRYGDPVGIIFSAAAFAAMHLFIFANMRGIAAAAFALLFAALFAVAVAWSLLARRPGGIHAAWLSHALTDAGLMTWGLFWLGYF